MKTESRTLKIKELIAINLEELNSFKKGDSRLLADDPFDDSTLQTTTVRLICGILKGVVEHEWEAMGIAEAVKMQFYKKIKDIRQND